MTDIVERLEDAVNEFYGRHPCGLLGEARHEIGRLRRRIDTLEGMLGEMNVAVPGDDRALEPKP